MTQDLNKGISDIAYNSLNLPRIVDIKNKTTEGRNEYTYSASGQKLRAVEHLSQNYSTNPVIRSAVSTTALAESHTTDYVGNKIYENNILKRILVDGGYYEAGNYYFYITDHLGNNRIVANAAASVVQSTQYYPFGTSFADATNADAQPYKYNGKELDKQNGLNMYDYSARWKDDFRFTTVDPLAEKYYSISPYVYVGNNPIKRIDPTGMDWYVFNLDNGGSYSHKVEQEGAHRMAVMSYEMTKDGHEYTKITFVDFNDSDVDAKAIDNGTFTHFEYVSDATVENQIDRSGVKGQGMSYANKASRQGAMDYGHAGAYVYGDLNKNTLYVRDGTAYNIGDYGNYLWGRAMGEMGISHGVAAIGAHANNFWNGWLREKDTSPLYDFGPGTYGKPSILDSPGDQRAILNGYISTSKGRQWLNSEKRLKKEYERRRSNNPKFSMSIM